MTSTVVTLLLVIAGALLAAVAAFLAYLYWWQIARAQPRLEGTLTLPGLDAPVEVLRDKHGVPHIYARSRADLFRAQGFVHAQDRFWQMEQQRRIARGTLAEIFGEPALEADRFSRTVGFLRAAEAELAALDAGTRAVLDWYTAGVNAYMAARPGRLAAEVNLLRFTPAPWTPADTLAWAKVMHWALAGNWEAELLRVQLVGKLGDYRAAELEPDAPRTTPVILEAAAGPQAGQAAQRLVHVAGLLLNQYETLKGVFGSQGAGQGSNSWVLAPARSLTRKPLLANDPHLVAQIPGLWYEQHLAAPDYEVSGVNFAGCPGVLIGHNDEIAWGITNACADVQDLYVERPHPDDPARVAFADGWEQAQVYDEVIRVRRRAEAHVERVVVTRRGPLITNLLPPAERAGLPPLAVRWTGHDAGEGAGNLVGSLLALNTATSFAAFDAALAEWGGPPLNFTYADARGNIGYLLAGRIPVREGAYLGLAPAPGWEPAAAWPRTIPHAELPRLYNPESGVIVTANNKPVGDDYPYFLGVEFFPGYRAQRIESLIAERERHSVRDMEDIQMDTGSTFAAELARWITLLNSDDPWEKVAIQNLRKWNHRMDSESVAALVFHYVLLELLDMVFGDKLGGPLDERYLGISSTPLFPFSTFLDRAQVRLLELLNNEDQSVWYSDGATGKQRKREELLQEALTRAVRRIRDLVGDSALKWNWGRSHQVGFAHPLGSARLLGNVFDRGPIPVGGDGSSPLQTRYTPRRPLGLVQVIPNYRQIFEVGNWDKAQTVTVPGQSGHPFAKSYDDQLPMWREGAYHLMPWHRPAVEHVAVAKLTLLP